MKKKKKKVDYRVISREEYENILLSKALKKHAKEQSSIIGDTTVKHLIKKLIYN